MLKEIKQRFFAYRNGITADVLRRGGSAFRMIFGVGVSDLSAMAREFGHDEELARELWNDSDVRESRLLSYWLMEPESLSREECLGLARDVRDREDAQMLAFRVLRRRPDARGILDDLDSDSAYAEAALALRQHLE